MKSEWLFQGKAKKAASDAAEICAKMLAKEYFFKDRLPDGRILTVRAIQPQDKSLLQEGMHHLSKRSRYNRFLTPKDELTPSELVFFTEIDLVNHVALGAILEENGAKMPVGVARYIASPESIGHRTAEVAFAVDDKHQGLGVGTVLLKHLIKIARSNGIAEFTALVLPSNAKMLSIFSKCGLPVTKSLNSADVYEVRLQLL